jgi:hypothetical protein
LGGARDVCAGGIQARAQPPQGREIRLGRVNRAGITHGHDQFRPRDALTGCVIAALDAENIPDDRAETIEQERAVAERHGVLREALVRLRPAFGS